MQDLLAKLVELWMQHPGAATAVLAGGAFAVLIWGVVSSSYRYR